MVGRPGGEGTGVVALARGCAGTGSGAMTWLSRRTEGPPQEGDFHCLDGCLEKAGPFLGAWARWTLARGGAGAGGSPVQPQALGAELQPWHSWPLQPGGWMWTPQEHPPAEVTLPPPVTLGSSWEDGTDGSKLVLSASPSPWPLGPHCGLL